MKILFFTFTILLSTTALAENIPRGNLRHIENTHHDTNSQEQQQHRRDTIQSLDPNMTGNHFYGLGYKSSSQSSCGDNEEYATCESSTCFEKTCEMVRANEEFHHCTRDCKVGCKCQDGYARNSSGSCVANESC